MGGTGIARQPLPQIKGITLMVTAVALLSVNDALIKLLTDDIPVGQVIGVRAAFSLLALLLVVAVRGDFRRLRIQSQRKNAVRSGFVVASVVFFVTSLSLLPFATAVTLLFAAPLFVAVLAPFLLGEKVGIRRWSAIVIGFIGVVTIMSPDIDVLGWALVVPIIAALMGALRDIVTRRMTLNEDSLAMSFHGIVCLSIAGLLTCLFWWETPSAFGWTMLALTGVAHFLGLYLIAEALRFGEASTVLPFQYTMLVWVVILNLLIWSEFPASHVMIGSVIVLASNLYIFQREMRLNRKPAVIPPAGER